MRNHWPVILLFLILSTTPAYLTWRSMDRAHQRLTDTQNRLVKTRHAVTEILNRQRNRAPDSSRSFGQADAVRLVNSALIKAGLSPSFASQLSLRDDPVRRQGRQTGRIQRLSITLRPIETVQLGRLLTELDLALPSFSPTEIGLQRPASLTEDDTRYGVELAFEREYAAPTEGTRP
ncbi:MAG TPA: hypothetical protein ENJ00_07930 [Phycisphaerales bacterium]|nr:hypothetical protein [Phycisphaerales bacterium]